jgi:hypothetical protein
MAGDRLVARTRAFIVRVDFNIVTNSERTAAEEPTSPATADRAGNLIRLSGAVVCRGKIHKGN